MADTWQTIEQAAVALGLSVRTINRHINAGKLQSRLIDGRREVLVCIVDPRSEDASAAGRQSDNGAADETPADVRSRDNGAASSAKPRNRAPEAGEVEPDRDPSVRPAYQPNPASAYDVETVLALADNAASKADLAVAALQTLARKTEALSESNRRSARLAWSAVAVMGIGVTAAVWWTTRQLTRYEVETQYTRQQLTATTLSGQESSAEAKTLRRELSAAREQAARTDGRLSALTDALVLAERAAARATPPAPAVVSPTPAPTTVPAASATPTPGAVGQVHAAPAPAPTTRPVGPGQANAAAIPAAARHGPATAPSPAAPATRPILVERQRPYFGAE